jgi:hypothetical protein
MIQVMDFKFKNALFMVKEEEDMRAILINQSCIKLLTKK